MITRENIIDNIYNTIKNQKITNREQARQIYNVFIDTIKNAVNNDERVQLHNFGSFVKKHYKEKQGMNIHTGQRLIAPAYDKIVFNDFNINKGKSVPIDETKKESKTKGTKAIKKTK